MEAVFAFCFNAHLIYFQAYLFLKEFFDGQLQIKQVVSQNNLSQLPLGKNVLRVILQPPSLTRRLSHSTSYARLDT